jgi:hypothetical protein
VPLRRNYVNRHTVVKQKRFMRAAEIVQPYLEAQLGCLAAELFRRIARGCRGSVSVGGLGNIRAPSGSLTSDRSTVTLSGTPAMMRRHNSKESRQYPYPHRAHMLAMAAIIAAIVPSVVIFKLVVS